MRKKREEEKDREPCQILQIHILHGLWRCPTILNLFLHSKDLNLCPRFCFVLVCVDGKCNFDCCCFRFWSLCVLAVYACGGSGHQLDRCRHSCHLWLGLEPTERPAGKQPHCCSLPPLYFTLMLCMFAMLFLLYCDVCMYAILLLLYCYVCLLYVTVLLCLFAIIVVTVLLCVFVTLLLLYSVLTVCWCYIKVLLCIDVLCWFVLVLYCSPQRGGGDL